MLANDVDSSGGELTLDPLLDMPAGTDAQVDGRRIIVHAPDTPTVLQIGYAVENDRGGRDSGVLTVTVADRRARAAADRPRRRRAARSTRSAAPR